MDVLLREVTGQTRGVRTYRDTVLSGQSFTLGAAPDQHIQLVGAGVQGNHAVLRPAGAGLGLQCRRGASVTVNGQVTRSAKLTPGDLLEVAGHQLTLIEPPAGFDLALEFLPNPKVDSRAYESAFTTDLDQTWLSRRAPSWLLLGAVLLLALAVPLGYLLLGSDRPDADRVSAPDTLWISGPLHPVHELAMGDDCSACHSELFHRVKDEDCRTCHDVLADHVPTPRAAELALDHSRCATCHREHNEPEHLVITSDTQCTACHADAHAFARPLSVAAVSGFALDDHPAFKARLLRPVMGEAGTGLSFDWRYEIAPIAEAKEESNLVFPHDVHLDEVKVRTPDTSSPLGCNDCHQLSADREHFEPITMEAHCADCHELTFDVTAPDRQLPHGQPREVAFAIEGYYLKKFVDPQAPADLPARRRRPDRGADSERCTDSPAVCAAQRSLTEVTNQFTVRGCVTCHTVSDTGTSDIYSRFQVHPVELVRDYFESGQFDHASHLTQEDKSGDAACLSCHPAKASQASADLLIPDIGNCTQCHGDPSVPNVVTLQCIDCHAFHPPSFRAARADPHLASGES